jgi:hypothetical protein
VLAVFGGAGTRQEIPTRHHKLESSQCRGGDFCEELRIIPPLPDNDTDVYIVIEDFSHFGRAFRETDLAEADLDTIVRNMISGEYRDPLRVVAFSTAEDS